MDDFSRKSGIKETLQLAVREGSDVHAMEDPILQ